MTLSKARDIWEIISRDFLSEIVSRLTGTYNAATARKAAKTFCTDSSGLYQLVSIFRGMQWPRTSPKNVSWRSERIVLGPRLCRHDRGARIPQLKKRWIVLPQRQSPRFKPVQPTAERMFLVLGRTRRQAQATKKK